MKTKLPSAIVYGWNKLGKFEIPTNLYHEENLIEKVIIYSLKDDDDKSISYYDADTVIHIYDRYIADTELANLVLTSAIENICNFDKPFFSIFTPTYKTNERIYRAYNSLLKQDFKNWEWVVVDDSDDDTTWNILNKISEKDRRVRIHKIHPITNGNIGLAKNRACSLSLGDWLLELDHDDELFDGCLSTCSDAIKKFPDSGFFYSDFCARFENGNMMHYDHDVSGNWYARIDNLYGFGYCGNVWENHNGQKYLRHYHCEMNPITIRFNITMPNHLRMWKKSLYEQIGGHNRRLPVADDFELIVRTFLTTRMTHIRKMLYVQWNNFESTVDNNSTDINRRARIIRDYYDKRIHDRIIQLGYDDWNWIEDKQHSQKLNSAQNIRKYYEQENIMNYIYE
jgi:glycosyltransferase involved in cell wall biosynthesis